MKNNYDLIFNNLDKEILKKMEDPTYEVAYNLTPDATELEKMKYQACQDILKAQMENNLSDEKIAEILKISIGKVKEVLFCQIYKFNLDELVTYLEKNIYGKVYDFSI